MIGALHAWGLVCVAQMLTWHAMNFDFTAEPDTDDVKVKKLTTSIVLVLGYPMICLMVYIALAMFGPIAGSA